MNKQHAPRFIPPRERWGLRATECSNYPASVFCAIRDNATGTTTFAYTNVTLNTDFQGANGSVPIENAPSSFNGVSSVQAPALPQYQFTWSGYEMIYNTAFAGGGSIAYNYPLSYTPHLAAACSARNARVRLDFAGNSTSIFQTWSKS